LIGDHFGSEAKVLLRKVELAQRKAVRHQAAVDFLTKCVAYNLSPRFLQFKLYRSNLQDARCVHFFRRFLLTKEINRRRQLLVAATNFEKEQRLVLFKQVGRLVSGPVQKFLLAKRNQDERDLQLVHQKKLRALGLSINKDSLQIVHNFSNRFLSVLKQNC